MTPEQKARLIKVLRHKMCGPCKRNGADPQHEACVEAEELIHVVEND